MQRLNIQKIRSDHNLTQLRLAELTHYPQSFISQIERGRAAMPEAFVAALQDALGIHDLEPYYFDEATPEEIEANAAEEILDAKATIARLLDMIDRRDKQNQQLIEQNKHLTEQLFAIYNAQALKG